MTAPHDTPEYAHWYQHYIALGDSPEDAARNAHAVTAEAIAKRKRSTNRTVAAAAAALVLVGAGITVAIVFGPKPTPGKPQTVTARQVDSPPPIPSPMTYTPLAADFTLTPKITKKECFGSAGCVVTFRIEVSYTGLPLSEDDEWLVTYSTSGGTDGPQVNSFTLRGTQMRYDDTEILQTPPTNTVLKVTVTAVAPN